MTTTQPSPCPECGGAMETGYIVDRGDHSVADRPYWVAGEPEHEKFLGMNAGLKTKDRPRYHVTTFRCARCGFLKSFARPEDAKP